MNQEKRRLILIQSLLHENPLYKSIQIPQDEKEQKQLLRSLMNIREASPISLKFQKIQDEYLQEENKNRGIIKLSSLNQIQKDIYLWRGDITRLECQAIVNAANSGMTGCYQPCHNCIDNCIHTYAGIQLRNYCNDLMVTQGHEEPIGSAKITPAFNLPCRFIIHTVGPIVQGQLTNQHCQQLRSCYRACLELADAYHIQSIAFCCISTGVFMFPNEKAAEIAIHTVKDYKAETGSRIEVLFNVFKKQDEQIYRKLLG
ncbi:protein-ADP-ribose hydrolase [Faecalicoccus pleomorphus]|uniref:protein-ADP-ribose hydrolase n=1 Tax=Faecalicoccus pleomorphus TaxID=1323 RepID=UPI00242B5CD0|nr:protein-ADP-ribose hydrolase [Faecalicoccus pleomorphus]